MIPAERASHSGGHAAREALNGAVQIPDHDAGLWRVRGTRTGTLLDGRPAGIRGRVLTGQVAAAPSSRS